MTIPMPVGLYIPTMAVGAGFGRLFGEVLYVLGLRPEPLSALFAVVGMCEREHMSRFAMF
jgi:H+/Cl- antiporter ClcA